MLTRSIGGEACFAWLWPPGCCTGVIRFFGHPCGVGWESPIGEPVWDLPFLPSFSGFATSDPFVTAFAWSKSGEFAVPIASSAGFAIASVLWQSRSLHPQKAIRAAAAKEVGVRNPVEETTATRIRLARSIGTVLVLPSDRLPPALL
jgi:hypothetical protein